MAPLPIAGASYCSSGDVLIRQGNFAADLQISDGATAWPHRDPVVILMFGYRASAFSHGLHGFDNGWVRFPIQRRHSRRSGKTPT